MRARFTVVAVLMFTILVAACRGEQEPPLPSFSLVPQPTGPTGNALPSEPPTGSPGITGAVDTGAASVTTTGAITTSASYPTLASPAIWTPPPGGIALNWTGAGDLSLGLSGASFTSQQPTAPARVLQFSVRGAEGAVVFRSTAGECLVTITPALPDQMGGTFLCTGIPSEDGAVTVNAQGSFNAE